MQFFLLGLTYFYEIPVYRNTSFPKLNIYLDLKIIKQMEFICGNGGGSGTGGSNGATVNSLPGVGFDHVFFLKVKLFEKRVLRLFLVLFLKRHSIWQIPIQPRFLFLLFRQSKYSARPQRISRKRSLNWNWVSSTPHPSPHIFYILHLYFRNFTFFRFPLFPPGGEGGIPRKVFRRKKNMGKTV